MRIAPVSRRGKVRVHAAPRIIGQPSELLGKSELAGKAEAGGFGNPPRVPITRVGGGELRSPEPERGRVWEPSQGSHYTRWRRRASLAGARAREGLGTLPGFPLHALAEASFARRSQSAGGFGNPPRVPITRVGGGELRSPEPERGRVWEPSQGSHYTRWRRRASLAGARAREGLGTLPGFPL